MRTVKTIGQRDGLEDSHARLNQAQRIAVEGVLIVSDDKRGILRDRLSDDLHIILQCLPGITLPVDPCNIEFRRLNRIIPIEG